MSHIVSITTQIRDLEALTQACRRLDLPPPQFGQTTLFQTTVEGWQVQLPGWKYPVVCRIETGELLQDNFEGHWGDPVQLHRLLQTYAVEKVRLEARRKGLSVYEHPLTDGSIRLTIPVESFRHDHTTTDPD